MAHDKRIEDAMTALALAFDGLAEVSSMTVVEEQNANYGRMVVKPGFRLGSALLASKEILILVLDFPEVQVRSVGVAERHIAESKGRLESGLAVIAHRDPRGDVVLREWGREAGLTILPLQLTDSLPAGDALQNALCSSLFAQDPFDLTGPVRRKHQFFGRSNLPDLARRLVDGHIHALFGIRKVGKTSVLNRLLQDVHDHHGGACAMVDCSDDGLNSLNAGKLLHAIAGTVSAAIGSPERYATTIPFETDVSAPEAARLLVNAVTAARLPVTIFIDEIDYITPSSPVSDHWVKEFNPFFRALRTACQELSRQNAKFSVVVSGVSSRWFSEEQIDGVENAAMAFVPEGYLTPLDRQEAVGMIQTLGRSAGIIFGDLGAAEVASICGDFPFWIRRAGSFINSCYSVDERPFEISLSEAAELTIEFIEVEGSQLAYSSLAHLFRIYPELGHAIRQLATDGPRPSPQLIGALGRYGILGDGLEPSGRMVAEGIDRWLSENPSFDRVAETRQARSSISAGSPSAAGEEEWADLLAEVSRRRNVVERALREFVLTVVRSECVASGRHPSEVLLAALPSDRRTSMKETSAKGILSKLYWPDLINVIRKNWQWFDKLFIDRKQLDLMAEIVNDRPDAHAKELDGAELALQRRAIKWFDDRITAADLL